MQKGAEAVHRANPNVLIIFSGLSFDSDLSFLHHGQVQLTFRNKTVFEVHHYPGGNGFWANHNRNDVCGQTIDSLMARAGFVLDQGYPLFVSKWGFDQTGGNENDNRYFNCFMGWFAEFDLEWAYWVLPGSYYVIDGKIGIWQPNTLLNYNWDGIRNQYSLARINSIQAPFQDQFSKPAKLGVACNGWNSKWEKNSRSKMHLSAKLSDANSMIVCLDVDMSNNLIVTGNCKYLSKHKCDPASQWFKIIDSTQRKLKNDV